MSIVRIIINWFKKLFQRLFQKKPKKILENNVDSTYGSQKKYLKGYGVFIEESAVVTIPPYLIVKESQKEKIVKKLDEIEKKLKDISSDTLKERKNIQSITKKIEKDKISIIVLSNIDEKIDELLSIPQQEKFLEMVKEFNNESLDIIKETDKKILQQVKKEYHRLDYVALTTFLIDDINNDLDYYFKSIRDHRHNRYYYNRLLNGLKNRIVYLQTIYDYDTIQQELLRLKKDLMVKNMDKYDLLYNDEIFLKLIEDCDNLLNSVNEKVVDSQKKKEEPKTSKTKEIKKQEERKKQEENQRKKEDELFKENILKRFKDMELARRLIELSEVEEIGFQSVDDLLKYLNKSYCDFLQGEQDPFYFERNRTKTELVKLCNKIMRVDSLLNNEEYLQLLHTNYRMDDILELTMVRKDKLEETLVKRFGYQKDLHEESSLVDDKIQTIHHQEDLRKGFSKVIVR